MKQFHRYSFLFVVILVHLVWFIAALKWQHIYNRDTYEYYYLFENLISGNYYSGNPALPFEEIYLSIRTPLYSWFLQFIHFIVDNNYAVIVVQNIISIFTCLYVFKIFSKYVDSFRQWIYWLFILAHPMQLMSANMLVPEMLLQVFLMLYFGNLVQYIYTGKQKLFITMSLWLLLAMATKPVAYPIILLHFVFVVWQSIKNRYIWNIGFALIPLIAVYSYGKWNEKRSGVFHITSLQPHNFINFWLQQYHSDKYGLEESLRLNSNAKEILAKESDFASRYTLATEMFKDSIKANFWSYSVFHAGKSLRYFINPGKGELDLFTGYTQYSKLNNEFKKENFDTTFNKGGISGIWNYLKDYPLLAIVIIVIIINVLRVIGTIIFLLQKKHLLILKIAIVIWIVYFAAISGPISNYARYFIPVLPILSACAAIGWSSVLSKRKQQIAKL